MKIKSSFRNIGILLIFVLLASCSSKPKTEQATVAEEVKPSVTVVPFGKLPDGQAVLLYKLVNKNGVELDAMNYGAIVTRLLTPDKSGKTEDVVLGFDSLSSYVKGNPYFGALVGRYGNRIAKGKFSIDGKSYTLAVNDGANHLHGGKRGFDKVFWTAEIVSQKENPAVKFTYTSKDGEEGYPGNLNVTVTYTLTEQNEWKIEYSAGTDKTTVLNLTQHTYFNLSGNAKTGILNHQLQLNADKYIPVDKGLIPTGDLKSVGQTPFDFRKATSIGARIQDNDEQLKRGKGYDHGWVFSDPSDLLKAGGSLYDPASGRFLEFSSTEPAVQFYSGNFLDGTLTGKYGVIYQQRSGLCLETEHYPDSPNQKSFPSVVLTPGAAFHSETVYKFSVK